MKFLIKIFIYVAIIILLISLSNCVKFSRVGEKTMNPNLEKIWENLFNDPKREKEMKCTSKLEEDKTAEEKLVAKEEGQRHGGSWNMPKKKNNFYAKRMIGWGPSAYLFDFLDDVLEKPILDEFEEIWKSAKATVPMDKDYKDPYTLEHILNWHGTEDELIKKIEDLTRDSNNNPTFDQHVWRESVTVAQIHKFLKDNNWQVDQTQADPAKAFVDKYDFNGDGRLSRKELLIGMIRANKQRAATQLCTLCLSKTVKELIDPIYMYLDCTNDEKVNAENIWTGIQNLKKPEALANRYKFWACEINGGKFRTSTVNDFVMKGQKTMDGFLSKMEFRLSILQGFWARHVDDLQIHHDNSLSMKNHRWDTETGSVDKVCEAMKNAF
jgi:hypothetical protein